MELMASHDFQTALHNYLDLEDLRSRLNAWKTSLDAFDDIIRLRGQNYEPLLPEVDAQFGNWIRGSACVSSNASTSPNVCRPC